MPIYEIKPSDVLFCRDARPMDGGGAGGHGANWPAPSLFFDAIHAALHRAFSDQQDWEHKHGQRKHRNRDDEYVRERRFGALKTGGPFPVRQGEWLFPAPGDVAACGKVSILPMKDGFGTSDLPEPLKYPLGSTEKPSKEQVKPWWSKTTIEAYLKGNKPEEAALFESAELFKGEWTTGIGIDPDRQTQDGKRIYSAEYLRLKEDVCLGAFAELPGKDGKEDAMSHLFNSDNSIIVMGGQQRTCRVSKGERQHLDDILPVGPEITCERVKWLLLSPAVFPRIERNEAKNVPEHPGGWLPNWIEASTGAVKLVVGGVGKNKAQRHKNKVPVGRELDVRLVAAKIPKPIVLSGWSERLHEEVGADGKRRHGAKPTLLAVPAGAVYYFDGKDARLLADLLNWHGKEKAAGSQIVNRRSSLLGEKGFGLGVCGTWEYFP